MSGRVSPATARRATGASRRGADPFARRAFLAAYRAAWSVAAVPLRLVSAQAAHDALIGALRIADGSPPLLRLAGEVRSAALPPQPVEVGGVRLPHPVIVAAGLVKGDGFDDERSALEAVEAGRDIVPGWRSLPALVGSVELGSYTRHPRRGNPGTVIWRHRASLSTQNRVGLRNPGAAAAAAFLARHADGLPRAYGINLAATPGVSDDGRAGAELLEAAASFESLLGETGRGPAWYTLNLSCPNTEDDPAVRQTEERARRLAGPLAEALPVPLWVKVGPALGDRQYEVLAGVLAELGARAVIATNTLPRPAPDGSGNEAGLGGGKLRPHALRAVRVLAGAVAASGRPLDIIACGGIMDAQHLVAARAAGARACMVYSALVFRGPLAPALIAPSRDRRRDRRT
jgi:dihydroorotate dehydrogenase